MAILLAGAAAGTINAVVGSGTLVTFPTLLAFGIPPVSANVSNNLGLVFGSATGSWGYRRELEGQRLVLARLAPLSLVGSIVGALLLLRLPEPVFTTIVPVLIGISLLLVLTQTRISSVLRNRRARSGRLVSPVGSVHPVGPVAGIGVLLVGVYGGYFGAAQGMLLVGWLGLVLEEPLQRVNATKNFLSAIVNGVAAVTFLVVSPEAVNWAAAGLIAVGSFLGGLLGARMGRRLRPAVLRAVIVVVGTVAISRLVLA